MAARQDKPVSAAELGEYVLCSRRWWLRHVEEVPVTERRTLKAQASGTRQHEQHGRRLLVLAQGQRLSYLAWLVALAALLGWLLLAWLGH